MIEAKVEPVPEERRCSEHRERPAGGTCERCGRFACIECLRVGEDQRCAACVKHLLAGVPSGGGLARWTIRLLYGCAVLGSFTFLAAARAERGDLEMAYYRLLTDAHVLEIAVRIGTGALYLWWLHRAVRQVQAFAVDVSATPGWAVGYWFVPFINFYRPYRIVDRLAAGAGAVLPGAALGGWWAAWVMSRVVIWPGIGTGEWSLTRNAISWVLDVTAAVLCAVVIRGIERGLETRRASLGDRGPPGD